MVRLADRAVRPRAAASQPPRARRSATCSASSAGSISAASSPTRAGLRGRRIPLDPVSAGGVLVITPNAGLRAADTPVTLEIVSGRLPRRRSTRTTARTARPLERGARALLDAVGPDCEVVLLGSIASGKYVEVLQPIFGDRLVFPPAFRRARRHEPRRADAALRRGRRRARVRAIAGAVSHMASGRRSCSHCDPGPRRRHASAGSAWPCASLEATCAQRCRFEIPSDTSTTQPLSRRPRSAPDEPAASRSGPSSASPRAI